MEPQGYVSSLLAALFEPVIHLIEELETNEAQVPNEVQTGILENGHSCGIAVLSVIALESIINKVKYTRGDPIDRTDRDFTEIAAYIGQVTQNDQLRTEVDELIAVRDAIVHSHLWEAEVGWNPDDYSLRFFGEPQLVDGFGNRRLNRVMDNQTRRTRTLDLNLFPTRIWRKDAYTIFRKVIQILESFEKLDKPDIQFSHFIYTYSREAVSLSEISERLRGN